MTDNEALVGRFEAMLANGVDNALLRFSLGQAALGAGQPEAAVLHLGKAVEFDSAYSAAWKLLGQSQAACGDADGARATFLKGIEVATEKGDVQAAKEMRVFLKRLDRKP